MKKLQDSTLNYILWGAVAVLTLGTAIAWIMLPQYPAVALSLLGLLAAAAGYLVFLNRKSFSGRSASHGIHAAAYTLVVLGLVVLANFVAFRHPARWDMTQNKRHSLAEQTVKVLKELKQPVKASFFYVDIGEKERARPLLENYRSVNPTKFELDYVDGKKEMMRARAANVDKRETLVLTAGSNTARVENPNEEKLTNALIKLIKEKRQTFCALTGHGEKAFSAGDENGYQAAQKGMEAQGYVFKEFSLVQQKSVPADCDAVGIIGPTKAFFPQEIDALKNYLDQGGRAVIAIDPWLDGKGETKEIEKVLESWYVRSPNQLILDDVGVLQTRDLAVIMSQNVSKEHLITREHDARRAPLYFVAPRRLEATGKAPAGINVQWLAKSLETAWADGDFTSIKKGKITAQGKSRQEQVMAFAVEGKQPDAKASRNTRLVVFGSSAFATNGAGRAGGNLDLFLNATSWVLEDESLISIRPKEDGKVQVAMSKQEFILICLATILLIPGAVVSAGIVIWVRRRKL